MDYTKMKHHTVNSYFLLLCKPSLFHHHFKDTDNVTNGISGDSFYVDVTWDIRLEVGSMFQFSWHVLWACKTLVSSFCLKKGMCHLYLHLCVTLLVTVTRKV